MGKSPRTVNSKSKAGEPGPGSYDGKLLETKAGKFTFGAKGQTKTDICPQPGPGAYLNLNQKNLKETNAGAYSMSRSRRNSVASQNVPGPGTYNPKDKVRNPKGSSYSMGARFPVIIQDETPGPCLNVSHFGW
jgi:hypothetical protein